MGLIGEDKYIVEWLRKNQAKLVSEFNSDVVESIQLFVFLPKVDSFWAPVASIPTFHFLHQNIQILLKCLKIKLDVSFFLKIFF